MKTIWLAAAGVAMALVPGTPVLAQSDCKAHIIGILKQGTTGTMVHAYLETVQKGKVISKFRKTIQTREHTMSELIGRNWWALRYNGVYYNSSDGKHWKKSQVQNKDWKKLAREASERVYRSMNSTGCGKSALIGDKSYQLFTYSYAFDKPYKVDMKAVMYYDPAAKFIVRLITTSNTTPVTSVITDYTKDPAINLPVPE